jgi:hypothetical protein
MVTRSVMAVKAFGGKARAAKPLPSRLESGQRSFWVEKRSLASSLGTDATTRSRDALGAHRQCDAEGFAAWVGLGDHQFQVRSRARQ